MESTGVLQHSPATDEALHIHSSQPAMAGRKEMGPLTTAYGTEIAALGLIVHV